MSDNVDGPGRRFRATYNDVEYKFTHVFPPSTKQQEFFSSSTLPLISSALEGQNALLFAYGVTNSGKTFTIQGGPGEDEAGILPRSLDAIFRSIKGHENKEHFMPVRLAEVEKVSKSVYDSHMADSADLLQSRDPDFLGRLADIQPEQMSITSGQS